MLGSATGLQSEVGTLQAEKESFKLMTKEIIDQCSVYVKSD